MKKPDEKMSALGSLYDDLTALAGKVYSELVDGDRTVWADDRAFVYASPPEETSEVPTSWIAGTFTTGHPASEIEVDLRALLRERARNWIIS